MGTARSIQAAPLAADFGDIRRYPTCDKPSLLSIGEEDNQACSKQRTSDSWPLVLESAVTRLVGSRCLHFTLRQS